MHIVRRQNETKIAEIDGQLAWLESLLESVRVTEASIRSAINLLEKQKGEPDEPDGRLLHFQTTMKVQQNDDKK